MRVLFKAWTRRRDEASSGERAKLPRGIPLPLCVEPRPDCWARLHRSPQGPRTCIWLVRLDSA
eukprot:scaffold25722_cov109-Isochrysis_galbana.AAC.2